MHRIDYQALSNAYYSYAWDRLSDTKQPKLVSCLEQTIIHYTTHTNSMPGTDFQTLSNPYYSHAWNRLSESKHPILISCLE